MSRKKQKKREKKKSKVAFKQAREARVQKARDQILPTANARIIRDLMFNQKIRGNYKDFVVLAGKRLVDWQDSYDMVTEEGKTVGVQNMALVHKSKLANIVGLELAGRFWRPGIGRINTKKGTRHGTP